MSALGRREDTSFRIPPIAVLTDFDMDIRGVFLRNDVRLYVPEFGCIHSLSIAQLYHTITREEKKNERKNTRRTGEKERRSPRLETLSPFTTNRARHPHRSADLPYRSNAETLAAMGRLCRCISACVAALDLRGRKGPPGSRAHRVVPSSQSTVQQDAAGRAGRGD